jgi:hypothetical protein
MRAATECLYQRFGFLSRAPLIAASLTPVSHNVPIRIEIFVRFPSLPKGVLEARQTKEVGEIVRIAGVHALFVGEIVALSLSGDACLERTLGSISAYVIGPFPAPCMK